MEFFFSAKHVRSGSYALLFASLFFALHPLRVEVIAWPSCLPHMLANMFATMCVASHCFRRLPGLERRCRIERFVATVHPAVLYALAVFSKTSTIGVPGILFLIDLFFALASPNRVRHGRTVTCRRVLVDGLCVSIVGVVAFWRASLARHDDYVQKGSVFEFLTPISTFAFSSAALVFYLKQTVWPFSICPWYPLPEWAVFASPWELLSDVGGDVGNGVVGVFIAVTILIVPGMTFMFASSRRSHNFRRWFAACSFCAAYLVLLIPTIGVISRHSSALAADRYAYLPAAFVFLPAMTLAATYANQSRVSSAFVIRVIAVVVLAGIVVTTRSIVSAWGSSIDLWTRATRVGSNHHVPYSSLGSALFDAGHFREAKTALLRSIELNPAVAVSHFNLGRIQLLDGEFDSSAKSFVRAANIRPSLASSALSNAGMAMEHGGRHGDAIHFYERALDLDPGSSFASEGLERLNLIDSLRNIT